MNWRRILASIAFGGFLIFVGGIFYLGRPHSANQKDNFSAVTKFAASKATIIISVGERPYSNEDHSLSCGGPDALTIALVLQSQKMQHRLFSAFTPKEIEKLLGPGFLQNGKTTFSGVKVAYDLKHSHVTITCRHRDPQVARLVVGRFYGQLTGIFSEGYGESTSQVLKYLDEKKVEVAERVRKREADLVAVTRSQNQQSIHEAEKFLLIDRDLLKNIENRIAETRAAATTPALLPFHVVEARVVSGPFWNRTVTDFTAAVAKLEKP